MVANLKGGRRDDNYSPRDFRLEISPNRTPLRSRANLSFVYKIPPLASFLRGSTIASSHSSSPSHNLSCLLVTCSYYTLEHYGPGSNQYPVLLR